jgi:hypothetical protein
MRTYSRLEQTFITDLLKLDPAIYGGNPKSYNRGRNILTFPNGSQIIFRSCANTAEVSAFQGSQFLLVIIDEASQFDFKVFEALQAVVRSPFRTSVSGDEVKPRLIMGSNPGGIGNVFLKALFISKQVPSWMGLTNYDPKDYLYIPSLVTDNPYIASDKDYLKMLDSLNPVLRAAWRDGVWDQMAGTFFDCFEPRRTVIPADECLKLMASQPWQPKFAGIDWGHVHCTAMLFATKIVVHDLYGLPKEHVLIYKEHSVKGIGEEAIAAEFVRANQNRKLEKIYADPSIFGDDRTRNSRAKVISDRLVLSKLPRLSRASNSRVDGWSYLRDMLGGDGERSRLLISDECLSVIESIPQALVDPKNPEDLLKTSFDSDDFLDVLRYTCVSHLPPRNKSAETLREEAIAPFVAAGNLNAVYMTHLQWEEKKKTETTMFYPKRRRRH